LGFEIRCLKKACRIGSCGTFSAGFDFSNYICLKRYSQIILFAIAYEKNETLEVMESHMAFIKT